VVKVFLHESGRRREKAASRGFNDSASGQNLILFFVRGAAWCEGARRKSNKTATATTSRLDNVFHQQAQ